MVKRGKGKVSNSEHFKKLNNIKAQLNIFSYMNPEYTLFLRFTIMSIEHVIIKIKSWDILHSHYSVKFQQNSCILKTAIKKVHTE